MENEIFFSKNLRTWLFATETTNAELADYLGLGAPSTVGKWISENRAPKGTQLIRLAELMGFDATNLINEDMTLAILEKTNFTTVEQVLREPASEYKASNLRLNRCLDQLNKVQADLSKITLETQRFLIDIIKS